MNREFVDRGLWTVDRGNNELIDGTTHATAAGGRIMLIRRPFFSISYQVKLLTYSFETN